MSELIPPPANWKFRLGLTAASLSAQLGKHRLLSIKSFLDGKTRRYSAVSVPNTGLGGSWDGHIAPGSLTSLLGSKLRLTALDCFEEHRKTFCAAAWIENKTGITWSWSYDLTPAQLDAALKKQKGKLISIRAYMTTLAGQLASPQIRYCAVWVKDDGKPWAWIPDA